MRDQKLVVPSPKFDGNDVILRTPENRENILIDFAVGMTWKMICAKYGCSQEGLRKWMLSDLDFRDAYLKSKEFAADFILERIEELAEAAATLERDKNGDILPGEKEKHSRYRTAIEGWKIALEKRAPKSYGQLLKLADADGNNLTIHAPVFREMQAAPIDREAEDAEVVENA